MYVRICEVKNITILMAQERKGKKKNPISCVRSRIFVEPHLCKAAVVILLILRSRVLCMNSSTWYGFCLPSSRMYHPFTEGNIRHVCLFQKHEEKQKTKNC